jgi:hypothetical protein
MTLDSWTAYDSMLMAYNNGEFWAALSLATSLHRWLEQRPWEAVRFGRKRIANVIAVEKGAIRRLQETTGATSETQVQS